MSKKKQPANPLSCVHHEATHCIVIDFKSHCATCAAERIAKMVQTISPRAMQHYVPLTEENYEPVTDRLHALRDEMKQRARREVQARNGSSIVERTGAGNAVHPEYATVNRLQQAIFALEKFWQRRNSHGATAVA